MDKQSWFCQRRNSQIVGTVSVMNNLHSPHSAWLFRLVVEKNYRNKGIGRELVRVVKDYCKGSGYLEVHAAVSECQENARQIFTDNGLAADFSVSIF